MSRLHRARRALMAAVVLMLAAPASSLALEGPPDQVGEWSPVLSWGVQAKHMSLLNNGQVLVWSQGDQARVWDPETGAMTLAPAPFGDVHCAGQVTLADGRVMVVGGQNVDTHVGIPVTSIFDPRTGTWSRGADMSYARWYPTLTTLADGRALVTSGDESSTATRVAIPEIYDPVTDSWTKTASRSQYLYPFMYQLSNGKVFEAGTRASTAYFSPAGAGSWTPGPTAPFSTSAYSESGAMYSGGKILRAGGGDPSLPQTAVIDTSAANPQWRLTAPMNHPRRRMNTPILLDGSIMAVGGTGAGDNLEQAVYPGEIWNPDTEEWTEVAAMSRSRMYHSTALTLPDGRVVIGGGEIGAQGADEDAPRAGVQKDAQIYSPPYLFKGTRPQIQSSPGQAGYGQPMPIAVDTAGITKVALMRPSAVTHAIDMNQRYVPLSFTRNGSQITATSPASAYHAPPGYYMLVVVDSRGVPSVAKWVLLGTGAPVQDPGPVLPSTAPVATAPPKAAFAATTPTIGPAPLTVSFANQSTGQVDAFAWDFNGDGVIDSGAANPRYTYRSPGTYSVKLVVRNAKGNSEAVRAALVTVTGTTTPADPANPGNPTGTGTTTSPGDGTSPGPLGALTPAPVTAGSQPAATIADGARSVILQPVADGTVSSAAPGTSAAAGRTLLVRQGTGPAAVNQRIYLKFDVRGLGAAPLSAKLRLLAADGSTDGGSVFKVDSAWTEQALTWNSAPGITGTSLASAGATVKGRWVELDVTRAITGDGVVSFALRSTSADAAAYTSRERADRPQLVLTAHPAADAAPVADFAAAPRSGTGPLSVSFSDRSPGATSWAWDFQGDGKVDSTQPTPRFTYTKPGTYSVRLTVRNEHGSDVKTANDTIVVGAHGAAAFTRRFAPVADAMVTSLRPRERGGSLPALALRQGNAVSRDTSRSYLKFKVAGIKGVPASAKLRLYVMGGASDGGSVFAVGNRWTEAALAWSSAPGITTTSLASAGYTAPGTWVELDVTEGVAGNGLVSFALASTSADGGAYASREDRAHAPRLVVTAAPGSTTAQAASRRLHLRSVLAPRPSLLCPLEHATGA